MQLLSDPAQSDLRAYHVARQLHLLPELEAVFTANALVYPLFYACLDPHAKALAKQVLLSLRRWLCARVGVNPAAPHPVLTFLTSHILSFLCFPALASKDSLPPPSLYVQLGVQAQLTHAAAENDGAASGQPRRATSRDSSEAPPTDAGPAPPDESASAVEESATPLTPTRLSTVTAALLASESRTPAELVAEVRQHALLYRPMFFVRPYVRRARGPAGEGLPASPYTHEEAAAGTHELFVRMAHPARLNEESLNPYFGRYGQVGCEALQQLRLAECPYASEDLACTVSSMFRCDPAEVWLQDFIVSVDSHQNAERAVQRAYYKELLFIALHDRVHETDAAGHVRAHGEAEADASTESALAHSNNRFSIADVDALMAESAAVYRLQPAASPGAAAASADSANDKHKTGKKRQRRSRTHKSSKTTKKSSGSSPAAKHGAPSVGAARRTADDDGASSSSSSSSSTTSSSSSSGRGGVGFDGADGNYIPHVVVDGFPYWVTEDQLKVLLQEHGVVQGLQLSVDDLTGAFTGAVLVHMSSVTEAVRLSDALHGAAFKGFALRAGVLNERLEIESLVEGDLRWPPAPVPGPNGLPPPLPRKVRLLVNERLWV